MPCGRSVIAVPALVAILASIGFDPGSDEATRVSTSSFGRDSAFGHVSHEPLIVAHRGSRQLCAENTLPCFRQMLDLGANALEADLQILGDGTLVIFHDENAFAQTGQDIDLADIDLQRMRSLDLGFNYSRDGGKTFPLRGRGLCVITLDEFLAALSDVPVLLDVKPKTPAMADAIVAFAATRLGASDRRRLYIKSNNQRVADALRELTPAPKVAFTHAERTRLVAALLLGFEPPIWHALDPSWIDLSHRIPRFHYVLSRVRRWATERGHILTASTINDPRDMRYLLDRDLVDGVVTDRADHHLPDWRRRARPERDWMAAPVIRGR